MTNLTIVGDHKQAAATMDMYQRFAEWKKQHSDKADKIIDIIGSRQRSVIDSLSGFPDHYILEPGPNIPLDISHHNRIIREASKSASIIKALIVLVETLKPEILERKAQNNKQVSLQKQRDETYAYAYLERKAPSQ